jgi:uncharacterized protein YehS (DUF1456 family)
MTNNDILRSIRNMLEVNNSKIVEICALDGLTIPKTEIENFMRSDEDPEYVACPDGIMVHFLDGLIFYLRGKDESRPPMPKELPVSNNLVMKKLRVAFQLKEEEMLSLINDSGMKFSKSELSAILRKKGHDNYRVCGDQVLRYFLKGLTTKLKP